VPKFTVGHVKKKIEIYDLWEIFISLGMDYTANGSKDGKERNEKGKYIYISYKSYIYVEFCKKAGGW
jgi:hypothetical protein